MLYELAKAKYLYSILELYKINVIYTFLDQPMIMAMVEEKASSLHSPGCLGVF